MLQTREPKSLPDQEQHTILYVLVADEEFPRIENLMFPPPPKKNNAVAMTIKFSIQNSK